MLGSNLCQLLCNGFCGVFFQFCLSRELIVRRDVSGICCVWRERAGMSLVLCLLGVSRVLLLPAARSRPPLACQAVLEKSRVSLHYPLLPLTQQPHTPLQGGLPAMGSGICDCALPAVETRGSFTTSWAGFRPSQALAWPAARSRSGTVCFNFSHSYRQRLSSLCLPSFPTLRKGGNSDRKSVV